MIYLLDNDVNYNKKLRNIFEEFFETNTFLVSSVITCEEYLVKPFATGNQEKIAAFNEFISDCGVIIQNIDRITAEKAAQIRVDFPRFKGMDSLQLAVACLSKCDVFLTNDKQLRQFREIKCLTVDEWEI